MKNEAIIVKELFTELNKQGLIKGFLSDSNSVRFQSTDGTMIVLKIGGTNDEK